LARDNIGMGGNWLRNGTVS